MGELALTGAAVEGSVADAGQPVRQLDLGQVQPQAEDGIILQAFQILQSRLKEKDAKIAELAPLAEQARLVEGTGSAMDMTAAAGTITAKLEQLTGRQIRLGRNNLYSLLREVGYIRDDVNQAYQRYVDQGLFKNVAPIRGGEVRESVKVTPKGAQIIFNKIIDMGIPTNIIGRELIEHKGNEA